MKIIMLSLAIFLISTNVLAEDRLSAFSNSYEQAGIPDFVHYVGKALPGRCFHTSGSKTKIASVLMVSFEEEGFEVVPFDAEKKRDDFFDKLSYEDVLKQFPVIKKMFLQVIETADGAVIEDELGHGTYRGEIRESEKYMILRVFINNKIFKYCNYNK